MNKCFDGIKDKSLAAALYEGYCVLLEAKVCGELIDIFNWLQSTGDWKYIRGGSHQNKLQIDVSPELLSLYGQLVKSGKLVTKHDVAFRNGITFSSSALSYRRAVDGILSEIRECYHIAARLEYEYYGHRGKENTWLMKGEEFMRKFMGGRPLVVVDVPFGMTDSNDDIGLEEVPDMITVTGEDGQTWQIPNPDKYPNKKKKLMQSSYSVPGDPLMEGLFTDFGKKLAKGITTAALMLGCASGAAHAGKNTPYVPPVYNNHANTTIVQDNQVKPTVNNKKDNKTTVNVKTTKTANGTITQAELHNLYMSKAYNDRVTELLVEMLEKTPKRNEQMMYDDACMQAMEEIISGKLKP